MKVPITADRREGEWRLWTGVQLALAGALTVAFGYALSILVNSSADLPLSGWHRPLAWVLVAGGAVVFGLRTLLLAARILGPRLRP